MFKELTIGISLDFYRPAGDGGVAEVVAKVVETLRGRMAIDGYTVITESHENVGVNLFITLLGVLTAEIQREAITWDSSDLPAFGLTLRTSDLQREAQVQAYADNPGYAEEMVDSRGNNMDAIDPNLYRTGG